MFVQYWNKIKFYSIPFYSILFYSISDKTHFFLGYHIQVCQWDLSGMLSILLPNLNFGSNKLWSTFKLNISVISIFFKFIWMGFVTTVTFDMQKANSEIFFYLR